MCCAASGRLHCTLIREWVQHRQFSQHYYKNGIDVTDPRKEFPQGFPGPYFENQCHRGRKWRDREETKILLHELWVNQGKEMVLAWSQSPPHPPATEEWRAGTEPQPRGRVFFLQQFWWRKSSVSVLAPRLMSYASFCYTWQGSRGFWAQLSLYPRSTWRPGVPSKTKQGDNTCPLLHRISKRAAEIHR